jgi:redox-sensitive bicupin YhaK (pirin superfamily)
MDRRNIVLGNGGELIDRDPFILMDEEWMQKPKGFPPHPHAGFEAITYVLEGGVEHWNSRGDRAIAQAGDAQWMIAGRGIVHSEMPHGDGSVHLLQLWINLPSAQKQLTPRYQFVPAAAMPEWREPGVSGRVIAGLFYGLRSPMTNVWPIVMADVRLEGGAHFREGLPTDYNAYVYVLSGGGTLGVDRIGFAAGDVINFAPTNDERPERIELSAIEATRAILWAGPPIRESVVSKDGFVMNTAADIEQVQRDYDAGRFDSGSSS